MRLLNNGFTLAELMISVAIIILLTVLAIPNLLRTRVTDNESAARSTLKTISTAVEAYAAEYGQGYPLDISVLITANPPYLNKNYIADSPFRGYNYDYEFSEISGYSCSAEPQNCGQTGSKKYIITTGGILTEADCGI